MKLKRWKLALLAVFDEATDRVSPGGAEVDRELADFVRVWLVDLVTFM